MQVGVKRPGGATTVTCARCGYSALQVGWHTEGLSFKYL